MPRVLAPFNRVVTNRVQGLWAPYLAPWVVVVHRGRRSGRTYRTPVFAIRYGQRLALGVLYGVRSDWVRNVLDAGQATVLRCGRSLDVTEPELIATKGVGLGWFEHYADHAVVVRIIGGPGVHSFDADTLGERECDAWAAYYRHDWRTLLSASITLVAEAFGMGRLSTMRGAWYVLRANQKWSPYPDNDAPAAREYMRRFYALVVRDGVLDIDPAEAARREVEWWHIHRVHQRDGGISEDELTASVAHLYGFVYSVPEHSVREAARLRVEAMRLSDEWVAAGCRLDSPLLTEERRTLVDSYHLLRAAVGR